MITVRRGTECGVFYQAECHRKLPGIQRERIARKAQRSEVRSGCSGSRDSLGIEERLWNVILMSNACQQMFAMTPFNRRGRSANLCLTCGAAILEKTLMFQANHRNGKIPVRSADWSLSNAS